jgi:hypothetical protein
MAAGIRITHPTERGVTFLLVDGKRPYRYPVNCIRCLRPHEMKTYHIDLDGLGAAIVSREIWDRLKRIPGQPFALDGEVAKPPAQIIGLNPSSEALPRLVTHQE